MPAWLWKEPSPRTLPTSPDESASKRSPRAFEKTSAEPAVAVETLMPAAWRDALLDTAEVKLVSACSMVVPAATVKAISTGLVRFAP